MIALDLDCPSLDGAARRTVALQVTGDSVQVAAKTADDRHGLATATALLAKDPHDSVVRKLRPFRYRSSPVGVMAAMIARRR
jgi:hypothetical protein